MRSGSESLSSHRIVTSSIPAFVKICGWRADRIRPEEMEAAARRHISTNLSLSFHKDMIHLIGEQGLRLSGGERQRLAIARALLKNAPILILDEPTANLDPLTEKQVLDTLFETMKGKTSLLITHRLIGLGKYG